MRYPFTIAGIFTGCALWLAGCGSQESIEVYEIPKETPRSQQPLVAGDPHPPMPQSSAPAQMGMTVLPGMAEQSEAFPSPDMQAPGHWEAQPLGQMRKGSWLIHGPDGQQADVSVLVFPGNVGGLLANLNRWNDQIAAPHLTSTQVAAMMERDTLEIDGQPALFVFLEGSRGQSTSGAIFERGGGTWFFKMMGDSALVSKEREAFKTFLDTVSFPPQ